MPGCLRSVRVVKCEESEDVETSISHPRAFPELLHRTPMNPEADQRMGYNAYKWGAHEEPEARRHGGKPINDTYDNYNGHASSSLLPWATDGRVFKQNISPETDRINQSYSNMIGDHLPKEGYGQQPSFDSKWEKLLALHHGLYLPHQNAIHTDDQIRLSVANYSERMRTDDPDNACRYLKIEEFRCLKTHQYEMNPESASQKCLKWFNEWTQCHWDQEKFNRGYTYIEPRPPHKRRPYIAAPNPQFL